MASASSNGVTKDDAIGTGDATGEGNSSSTSVPLSFQTKPTILLIEISLVSMFMMDRPDSSNCWCDVQSRAPEIVAGLKPLRVGADGSQTLVPPPSQPDSVPYESARSQPSPGTGALV